MSKISVNTTVTLSGSGTIHFTNIYFAPLACPTGFACSGYPQYNWTLNAPASPAWAYRKPIAISSGASSALTSYQVNVTPYVYNETGLVGSWHFNEANATAPASDSSGQGNTGTLMGRANRTTEGKFGNAMTLGGRGDYVDINPYNPSSQRQSRIFTVNAWVKSSASGMRQIYDDYAGSGGTGILIIMTDGKIYARLIATGCDVIVQDGGTVNDGAWHFISVTFNNTNIGRYIDATPTGSVGDISGCTALASTTRAYIGINNDAGSYPWDGTIDEVRIYNRALSATEIQQQYQAAKARLDYQDIRFTDSDGATPLPFWMESDGKFWVKVPSIPTTGTTIYAYYGNPQANDAQNGTGTFEFFDDFSGDLGKWNLNRNTPTIRGGEVYLPRYSPMVAKTAVTYPAIQFSRLKGVGFTYVVGMTSDTNDVSGVSASNGFANYEHSTPFFIWSGKDSTGTENNIGSHATWGTYYTYEQVWTGTSFKITRSDFLTYTKTDNIPTVNLYPILATWNYNDDDAMYVDYIYVRKYAATEPYATNGGEETGLRGSYLSNPTTSSSGQAGSITPVWSSSGSGTLSIEVSANNGTNWHPAANNTATAVTSGSVLRFRANFTNARSASRLSDISLYIDSSGTPTPTPTPTPTGQPPSVTLSGSPPNLACSATSYNSTLLKNATLYTNFTGGSWSPDQTKSVNGTSNSTIFQKTAPTTTGNYSWNCLALDSSGLSAFAGTNATVSVQNGSIVVQNVSSAPATILAAILQPLSVLSGNTMSFTVGITGPANETIVGIIPSVTVTPQARVTNVLITPATLPILPANSSANFTVTFSYSASGQVSATFTAAGTSQLTAQAAQSNAVTSQLYMGSQFTLSLSAGKIEVQPKGGGSVTVLARNTAAFDRQNVRLKLSDAACCSFSLNPNGIDIPAGSGATFIMTMSPVSTAQPGTVYTTGIVAYTDTEPSLALADFAVSVLKDAVPETGAARERALSSIKNANDTILFVDRQIADAERQKLDTYRAATTLAEARGLYKDALALMDSSDYDGAYLKATDALSKAQFALTAIPLVSLASTATATKEQAEAYLRTANDTIFFVDTQIALAERQKVPLQEAVGKLAEARGLMKRAQSALSAGNYRSAADLSTQATTLATSALQSIPKPGQAAVTNSAIIAAAVLAIAAIIWFRFFRKQPPKPSAAQYYQQPQYYYQAQPPHR